MKSLVENEKGRIEYLCTECGAKVSLEDEICPICKSDLTSASESLKQHLSDYELYSENHAPTNKRFFCKKCGSEVKPGEKLCFFCGEDEIEAVDSPQPAGFWIRVAASFIDGLIFILVGALSLYNLLSLKSLPLMFILAVPSLLYKPLMESHYGATLGKMAMGIMVIDKDGEKLNKFRAYIRSLPNLMTAIVTVISNFYLFQSPDFANLTTSLELKTLRSQMFPISLILNILNFINFIDVIFVAFTRNKRAIHDYMAGSFCVKK